MFDTPEIVIPPTPRGFVPLVLSDAENAIVDACHEDRHALDRAVDSHARSIARSNGWNEGLASVAARLIARRCWRRRHSPISIVTELREILDA